MPGREIAEAERRLRSQRLDMVKALAFGCGYAAAFCTVAFVWFVVKEKTLPSAPNALALFLPVAVALVGMVALLRLADHLNARWRVSPPSVPPAPVAAPVPRLLKCPECPEGPRDSCPTCLGAGWIDQSPAISSAVSVT